MKLRLSEELSLPLDAATQTFAFVGRKGSGKTFAAGKLTELLMDAGVQCVILDTVGNWYGLRLGNDGKSPGFDIPVLGGLRGDIPLETAGAELSADLVVETGRSVVLDLSQFNLADRKRFATGFGIRLWQRKKAQHDPSPIHLVVEESQLIIPQFVRGDDAKMVGIYEEVIRLGRNYGIGVSMITQRPQSVNKEVLTQTECLIVFQVNGTPERKALREWVVHQGMDVNLLDELPGLPIGTAYLWSPQWLRVLKKIPIAPKRTFDASATPKVGERRKQGDLAPLDLAAFKEKMAATIERAKENDPAELKRTLSDLRRKLATAEKQKPAEQKAVLTSRNEARLTQLINRLGTVENLLRTQSESIPKLLRERQQVLDNRFADMLSLRKEVQALLKPANQAEVKHSQKITHSVKPIRFNRERNIERNLNQANGLPIGEKKILRALIQYPDGLRREQLTVLTGYKRSSRDAYISRLREKGYVSQDADKVLASQEGLATLPDAEPLPTGEELQEHWRHRLPVGELAILEQLLIAYPKSIQREALEESTGYKRSSRDAYISRLRAKELVTESGRGEIRASDHLF